MTSYTKSKDSLYFIKDSSKLLLTFITQKEGDIHFLYIYNDSKMFSAVKDITD